MEISKLKEFIETGRELEFEVNGRRCSLTYGVVNKSEVISFCEFNQPSTEVKNLEDLLKISYKGKTFEEIWGNVKEEDLWVY